jgi:hypothetical protein
VLRLDTEGLAPRVHFHGTGVAELDSVVSIHMLAGRCIQKDGCWWSNSSFEADSREWSKRFEVRRGGVSVGLLCSCLRWRPAS